MEKFEFQNKTKIIFGKDTETKVGLEIKSLGSKKILIHYGSDRLKKSGFFDKVVENIKAQGIEYFELGGVVSNPRISKVREGIELVKKENIDFVLAIGGGSVIDSAKAIALGAKYDGDVWDFYEGKAVFKDTLPVGTILTIPAAGSEASNGSVITDEITKTKRAFGNPGMQPKFSILNPELTLTLPDYQTACGAADMLAHTMERYFVNEKNVTVTDNLCLAHMRSIITTAKLLLKDTNNFDYRSEIMLSGYVAHNGWLNVGRGNGDWASHMIEHELSAEYDIAHGAGLAIIFPAWMKYVYKENIDKFLLFGQQVFNISKTGEQGVLETIKELELFFKEIGLPITMAEANISNPDISKLAKQATWKSGLGSFKKLERSDVEKIYKLAL